MHNRARGWRRLGYKLKIKEDDLNTISPKEDEVIFNYVGGSQVCLTMTDLIWVQASTDRKDAFSMIKDFFPG